MEPWIAQNADAELFGAVVGIAAAVLFLTWAAKRVAVDMDSQGKPGWVFAILVLFLPPLGAALWLAARDWSGRERTVRGDGGGGASDEPDGGTEPEEDAGRVR